MPGTHTPHRRGPAGFTNRFDVFDDTSVAQVVGHVVEPANEQNRDRRAAEVLG